jgi:hypothetical protein
MLFFYRGALVAALLAASLIGGSVVPGLNAQESSSSRRIKSKVAPLYPELARKMNVSGKVKLSVTVAPNGQVTRSEVLGGHPCWQMQRRTLSRSGSTNQLRRNRK